MVDDKQLTWIYLVEHFCMFEPNETKSHRERERVIWWFHKKDLIKTDFAKLLTME
jgi:hypothetical protein